MKTVAIPVLSMVFLIMLSSCSTEVGDESLTRPGTHSYDHYKLDYSLHLIKTSDIGDLSDLAESGDSLLKCAFPDGFSSALLVLELTADNYIDAGNILITDDKNYFHITFTTKGGWTIDQVCLYLGTKENIPLNRSNIPVPGLFPVKEIFSQGAGTVVFTITKNNATTDCPVILANAKVSRSGQSCVNAWGRGNRTFASYFDNKRWGFLTDNLCSHNYYAVNN